MKHFSRDLKIESSRLQQLAVRNSFSLIYKTLNVTKMLGFHKNIRRLSLIFKAQWNGEKNRGTL